MSQVSLGTMDASNTPDSVPASQVGQTQATKSEKSEKKKSTKGEIFYYKFQRQIDDYMLDHFGSNARSVLSHTQRNPLMLRLLSSLIDRLMQEKKPNLTKNFLQELFKYMSQLSNWALNDSTLTQKANILDLLRRLLLLDLHYIASNKDASEFIRSLFISFMGKTVPLSFKAEVLDILPEVITLGENTQVKEKLMDMVIYDFPSSSKDLPEKSVTYNLFISALDKLLNALEKSGNLVILESLFPTLREKQHNHWDKIQEKLKSFVNKASDENAKKAFEFCFQHFSDKRHDDNLRLTLAKHLCNPLVSRMSTTNATEIFGNIVNPLITIVQATTHSSDVNFLRTFYVEKIGALLLMEALYKSVPSSAIKERLNRKYYDGSDAKGTELTQAVMRAAHNAKTENVVVTDVGLKQLRFEYECTAYNTLASIVISTQNKDSFYHIFFFKENLEKGERIWEHIVDLDRALKFEVETNFPVLSKAVARLRQEIRKQTESGNNDLRYISSQYLADSSLSQDLQQKGSFFGKNVDTSTPNQNANPSTSTTPAISNLSTNDAELEMDELNSNPCMPILLDLIDTMMDKFGATYDKQ